MPLWWAAAAGLYSNKGSTGEAIQSDVETVIDGSGQFPEQRELRLKSYQLVSEQETLRTGLEHARLIPGAVAQLPGMIARMTNAGYQPLHQAGTALAAPFRRADLPPATGLEGLPSLAEMVSDFLAGARVPVASAFPPPWRPNSLLAGTVGWLGAGLAQLWGLFNRPPGLVQAPDWNVPNGTEATYATPRTVYVETWGQVSLCATKGSHVNTCSWWGGGVTTSTPSYTQAGVVALRLKTYDSINEQNLVGPAGPFYCGTYVQFVLSSGYVYTHWIAKDPGGFQLTAGQVGVVEGWAVGYPTKVLVDGQEQAPPLIPGTVSFPGRPPAASVLPAADPQPGVAPPVPRTLPNVPPGSEPVEQPQPVTVPVRPPGRASPPITAPAMPRPGTVPARPLTNAGTLPQPARTPTPTTPGTSVVPWPGARPINADPLAPPATIEGIAKKTGELEGKLDQIGGMLQPPDADFDWGSLFQTLVSLANWLSSADPEGAYEISSPCVTGGEGSADEPLAAGWPATIGGDQRIIKRLDALAELLQHHKTLRQPSCKNPSPTGEVVTVQFEET